MDSNFPTSPLPLTVVLSLTCSATGFLQLKKQSFQSFMCGRLLRAVMHMRGKSAKKGYISIGWDDFGDLSKLAKADFADKRVDAVRHPLTLI